MSVLKNTDTAIFIMTNANGWARLGEGVSGATPSNNATVQTKHYIHMKSPKNTRTAFSKQWSLDMERFKGDEANDYIYSMSEKTGADVETKLLVVDMSGTSPYPAKKYGITVNVDSEGNVIGGETQAMSVTLLSNGDPVIGTATINEEGLPTFIEG